VVQPCDVNEDRLPNIAVELKPKENRPVGRSRKRRMYEVRIDRERRD